MSVLERVQKIEASRQLPSQKTDELKGLRERLKARLLDRMGLGTIGELLKEGSMTRAKSEIQVALEAILNTEGFEEVHAADRELLSGQVIDEICGLGPIQRLLEDKEITEVMVNGTSALFYEKNGELHESDIRFDSAEQIMIAIDRILAPLGRRLDRSSPLVNARLANGDRVNAVAAPIAIDGPAVTIRKFSQSIRSLDTLVRMGCVSPSVAQLLRWAVGYRASIAVAGGTGSGKTTLLNALSCEIPPAERIVTIEDSAELRFEAHPNVVRLEARDSSIEGVGAITIRDLVKNALRMRPDRIVVGEVRGEECVDMLQAMNTGHDGSLTTLHAGTAEEAILRLVLMARFGMDLPTPLIKEQIATAIDLIVVTRRFSDGRRYLTGISEVNPDGEAGCVLKDCVDFDEASRSWRLISAPAFLERAVHDGNLSREEVEQWKRFFVGEAPVLQG